MKTSQWLFWGFLTTVGIILELVVVLTKLEFLQAQKLVQNGDCTKWQMYLLLLVFSQFLDILKEGHDTYYRETVKRNIQINMLDRYQTFGRMNERGILMLSKMVAAEILIPLNIITVIIGFGGMFKNIQMLSDGSFTWSETIAAIFLFCVTILTGAISGILDSKEEETQTILSVNRNDCLKFQLFSESYKKVVVGKLDRDSAKKTWQRTGKEVLRSFPRLLKQALFVMLVWGMVDTIAGTSLYSETYLLLSAFGTVLNIAEGVGRIISKLVEVSQMKKNRYVQELYDAEKRRDAMYEQNKGLIILGNKKLTISKNIIISIKVAGHQLYYSLPETIVISLGQHVIITGAKKTGKTRLLNVIAGYYKDKVLIYSTNSKILANLGDNFGDGKQTDVHLIKELATGLHLVDLEKIPDDEIENWHMGDLNTGDKNLLTVLVMLYMGIKEPERSRIMVFDEVLANIDGKNSEEILNFIMEKVNHIGATAIFVAHNQQELIRQYCVSEIVFERTKENVVVTQTELKK